MRSAVNWLRPPAGHRLERSLLAILALAFAWAYWPTAVQLLSTWREQVDYSHGFLVVPLALFFLWLRQDSLPAVVAPDLVTGGLLLLASVVVRCVGLRYSFDSLDGYSLILWVAAMVALLRGRATLAWALPAILFLLFMVPLPFRVEQLLSMQLQRVATAVSCFLLQCLGQPAFAERTTIVLGVHELAVEQECSGLRMFVGTFALACAYLMVVRREVWEQVALLLAVVPIAIVANSLRIVVTGLLYQAWGDTEAVRRWSHDLAGLFMMPLCAALFALTLGYLARLVMREESMRLEEVVTRGKLDS
jgi:exosortase